MDIQTSSETTALRLGRWCYKINSGTDTLNEISSEDHRRGTIVEIYSHGVSYSDAIQLGAASNSTNVLAYSHYDWTGNNYRYGAWVRR